MLKISQEEEIRLVERAKDNLESFSILYEMYFEKIYKYFHFRLRNKEDSEELTSRTFEKAIVNLQKFKDQGYSFSAWLFRLAHNNLIDFFREQGKATMISFDELEPSEEPATEDIPDFVDNLDKEEGLKRIKEILGTLSEKEQEIWALKLNGELSHKEIAATLKITENYVNVILFRSIKVIKSKLFR